MVFTKAVKDKAYFKRYQVKYRRRREGKTDYYARKRMVAQDKNKYNAPKYRLVIRFTNKDIACQIIYARIEGDKTLAAAYSHELPRYGVKAGLKNYAAAYCVGLLLARRVLTQLKLADRYQGKEKISGEDYNVEDLDEGPSPFRCFLDVGLARTTTGSRVFAAMKGAADGGLEVPHNEKRLVGYCNGRMNTDKLRHYLFGGHVSDYMKYMENEDDDEYKEHFSHFLKEGITPDTVKDMYEQAHKKIREDPTLQKKAPKDVKKRRWTKAKLTLVQRKCRVAQKKKAFLAKLAAASD